MADRRSPSYRDVAPVRPLVTEDEAMEAMAFVDTIAHEFARTQAYADFLEYRLSIVEAVGATLSDERSVDKRKWDARASAAYSDAVQAWYTAKTEALTIKAKRDAAMMKLEIYRTGRADQRAREVFETREADLQARAARDADTNPRGGFPPPDRRPERR